MLQIIRTFLFLVLRKGDEVGVVPKGYRHSRLEIPLRGFHVFHMSHLDLVTEVLHASLETFDILPEVIVD